MWVACYLVYYIFGCGLLLGWQQQWLRHDYCRLAPLYQVTIWNLYCIGGWVTCHLEAITPRTRPAPKLPSRRESPQRHHHRRCSRRWKVCQPMYLSTQRLAMLLTSWPKNPSEAMRQRAQATTTFFGPRNLQERSKVPQEAS